jgi:hypothetical protein
MSGQNSLRFRIRDDLSGIDSYEGFIDSNWVLFEYDPKYDLLFYIFDGNRLQKGNDHELELYIRDNAGNKSVYHSKFHW